MNRGYRKPLYLLPFDHRHSFVSGMFGLKSPLTSAQHLAVADSKQIIYNGFQLALTQGVEPRAAALLVDEEFGTEVLRDATRNGYTTAVSVEKSGVDEFEFEYGEDFPHHIERFSPTFAKILVRYNPDGDAALNTRQTARIKALSDYCQNNEQLFMFELLVPATPDQLTGFGQDARAYDVQLRPQLVARSIKTLQDEGIEPDVWKIEGVDARGDLAAIVQVAQRDGRDAISCIVLGRAAERAQVESWLKTAANVPGVVGFAVGRSTFWEPLAAYRAGLATPQEAAAQIAERYVQWVQIFEQAQSA